MTINYYLSINRCRQHGQTAICLGNGETGTRLTPSKCCGSWSEVEHWKLSPRDIDNIVDELLAAKEQIESHTGK